MNVIVCGSAKFDDRVLVIRSLNQFSKKWPKPETTIITGGTEGPNRLGYYWALDNGYNTKRCYPDWNEHGAAAGSARNIEMITLCKEGDWCVAFIVGRDAISNDLIKQAKKKGLHVEIID